jgi:metal-dependent HD superfamily phosphatase/phosphodiesterase
VSSTLYIPVGSKLINIVVDVLTAFNSATSAVLSVGITAGGTEYASGVDVKTATGRITPTFTAAQLAAMSNVSVLGVAAPTPAPVVVTVTPTGATSAGYVRVTLVYAQQP